MADATPPEPDRLAGYPHPRETARLFGQAAAERAFLDAWAGGRLHHAWLLRGPEGIGKATFAYRIARAVIARAEGGGLFGEPDPIPATLDAPEGCPVAARILAQGEPRLFSLRRSLNDTGRLRTVIAVEDVRRLRNFLQHSAADGGWRAVIVDAADEMNRNAANALLKSLEEPPAKVLFLLVSHAPAGLLPTIRSRCRTLDLAPLGDAPLAEALVAAGSADGGDAPLLTGLAGGSVRRALILADGGGAGLYADLCTMLSTPRGLDRSAAFRLADRVSGRANEAAYRLTLDLIAILMARLARAGAGHPPQALADGEADLIATAASTPAQARLWAEAAATVTATAQHALGVNLDPAQTIIDTLLELDTLLGRARAAAA